MPGGPRNEREILTLRLIWSGFVVFDRTHGSVEATQALVARYRDGKLTYDENMAHGIEHAPRAIKAVYAWENRGKKLIYVG